MTKKTFQVCEAEVKKIDEKREPKKLMNIKKMLPSQLRNKL